MSVQPVEPTPPAVTEPPAAAPTPPVDPKPTPPAAPAPSGNVWDDPQAAQAEIEKLRRERGAERTTAKAQAAEDAKKELTGQIAKALGLVDDDSNDPAKLTEKLTASQTAAQQARVELAVFRAAAAAGGDPTALLDSTSFLKSLADVDPSDTAAVQAAITAAVAANARLGVSTGATPPAPNPAQGAGANGPAAATQLTRADLANMSPEAIEKARLEGRLNVALGIKA